MCIWRMNLRKTKSAIISWDGSNGEHCRLGLQRYTELSNIRCMVSGKPAYGIASSIFARFVKFLECVIHKAHSWDSDQTWKMPRLIWAFAGCTSHFVGFVMSGSFQIWIMCVERGWCPTRSNDVVVMIKRGALVVLSVEKISAAPKVFICLETLDLQNNCVMLPKQIKKLTKDQTSTGVWAT